MQRIIAELEARLMEYAHKYVHHDLLFAAQDRAAALEADRDTWIRRHCELAEAAKLAIEEGDALRRENERLRALLPAEDRRPED